MDSIMQVTRKTIALALMFFVSLTAFPDYAFSAVQDVKVIQVACRDDYQEIWDAVNEELKLSGENLKVVNTAYGTTMDLNDMVLAGDIDINTAQHYAWLDFVKSRGEKYQSLKAIGEIHIATLDLYSQKFKSLESLPEGATISIPNSAINGGRALYVLATSGLIKLPDGFTGFPTQKDVVYNPKKFTFVEIPSETMVRTLEDVDAGFVYSINAVDGGLNPITDPILHNELNFDTQAAQKGFIIIFTVRGDRADDPDFKKIIKAYHSDRVYRVYKEVYKNSLIPVFDGKAVDLSKY
jgi:D-methionine transport system substrate-binding protein